MKNECCGLMGKWFGHKFIARYDQDEPNKPISVNDVNAALHQINHDLCFDSTKKGPFMKVLETHQLSYAHIKKEQRMD